MKSAIRIAILLLSNVFLLSGCLTGDGGKHDNTQAANGSGGTGNLGQTTFYGGTLDELKALSPTLEFGDLILEGQLVLPISSATTIKANNLSISAAGGVKYTYTTCQYAGAPDLTLVVTEDVSIKGEILLTGRSGTSVTSGASCNSCYGQDGGNLSISARNIAFGARFLNYGGYGGTYRDSYGSSGCSGGDSGATEFTADNIDFTGLDAQTHGGRGGAQGFGYGPSGQAGDVSITANNAFKMNPGSIQSDGTLMFRALQTDIVGPITYGTLDALINGSTDQSPPQAVILKPITGAVVALNQPMQIEIQASDAGIGVRDINVKGFGYDATYAASDMLDGVLTVELPAPQADTGLTVTVRDNQLQSAVASVDSLLVSYGVEQEANDSPATAQAISFPVAIEGVISPTDAGTCDQGFATAVADTNCIYHTAQDYYTFSVANSGNYKIVLDFYGNGSATDLDLYLDYASSGSGWWTHSIADNAGTQVYSETLNVNLWTNEVFTLAIQAWPSWTGTASYRLTIQAVP